MQAMESLLSLYKSWDVIAASTDLVMQVQEKGPFGLDVTIEGLRSRQYGVAIFGFLILQVALFGFIIQVYMRKSKATLKRGEKVMFGALIMGIVVAVFFGWLQIIEGYLI